MILMYGLGGTEILLISLPLIFALWGYKAGSIRTIGGGIGFLLGMFLSVIGIIIIYSLPRTNSLIQSDVPEQLKKFKELLDRGAITEDEYQSQKAKLLK